MIQLLFRYFCTIDAGKLDGANQLFEGVFDH